MINQTGSPLDSAGFLSVLSELTEQKESEAVPLLVMSEFQAVQDPVNTEPHWIVHVIQDEKKQPRYTVCCS